MTPENLILLCFSRLLFDFVADKVIIHTAREREPSRTRAHQRRLQRLAGGHATPQ
jgi:hypothetical protein